jgi:ketosteroid isomerase-like protein
MSGVDDFLGATVPQQVAADEALYSGDPEPRIGMWSTRDPVTLFSAGGECKSGYEEVTAFFRWLATRYSNASDLSFDIEAAEVSGDLAYMVGFERFRASIEGAPVGPKSIRATHIYRREDGKWKIVHRHGDAIEMG